MACGRIIVADALPTTHKLHSNRHRNNTVQSNIDFNLK